MWVTAEAVRVSAHGPDLVVRAQDPARRRYQRLARHAGQPVAGVHVKRIHMKHIRVKRINRTRLAASMSAAIVAALGFAIVRGTVATAASFPAECPWMDTSLSADQRARALLDHSTLDQKTRWLDEQAANTPTQTSFGGSVYPVQVPCTPTIIYTDGPYGVTGQTGVTAFPAPISQAASFDLSTSLHKGEAVSTEAFTKRRNVILAPGVASGRTPLSGRTPEYFSEDPLLAGRMAGANISGIQEHDDTPTVAVLKHYVANEQELDRQRSSSNIDTRTLQEIYTLPFGIASDLATQHLNQYWNTGTGAWSTADGSYTITVGGSFNTSLTDTFTVHHSG
jgi:beta-glucosidase-like glycosyl hydrolase